MIQELFPQKIMNQLIANGKATNDAIRQGKDEPNHKPVVKIFNPAGSQTWLISEADPQHPDILMGMCDLGMGCVEFGSVLKSELESIKITVPIEGMPGVESFDVVLERDIHFKTNKTVSDIIKEGNTSLVGKY